MLRKSGITPACGVLLGRILPFGVREQQFEECSCLGRKVLWVRQEAAVPRGQTQCIHGLVNALHVPVRPKLTVRAWGKPYQLKSCTLQRKLYHRGLERRVRIDVLGALGRARAADDEMILPPI